MAHCAKSQSSPLHSVARSIERGRHLGDPQYIGKRAGRSARVAACCGYALTAAKLFNRALRKELVVVIVVVSIVVAVFLVERDGFPSSSSRSSSSRHVGEKHRDHAFFVVAARTGSKAVLSHEGRRDRAQPGWGFGRAEFDAPGNSVDADLIYEGVAFSAAARACGVARGLERLDRARVRVHHSRKRTEHAA